MKVESNVAVSRAAKAKSLASSYRGHSAVTLEVVGESSSEDVYHGDANSYTFGLDSTSVAADGGRVSGSYGLTFGDATSSGTAFSVANATPYKVISGAAFKAQFQAACFADRDVVDVSRRSSPNRAAGYTCTTTYRSAEVGDDVALLGTDATRPSPPTSLESVDREVVAARRKLAAVLSRLGRYGPARRARRFGRASGARPARASPSSRAGTACSATRSRRRRAPTAWAARSRPRAGPRVGVFASRPTARERRGRGRRRAAAPWRPRPPVLPSSPRAASAPPGGGSRPTAAARASAAGLEPSKSRPHDVPGPSVDAAPPLGGQRPARTRRRPDAAPASTPRSQRRTPPPRFYGP